MKHSVIRYWFWFFFILIIACTTAPRAAAQIETVTPDEFQKQLQNTREFQLIDVRTPEEFGSGHLNSAININLYDKDFIDQLSRLKKEKPVFVYCKAGSRSETAAEQLKTLGFKTVFELQGGIVAWTNAGKPLEQADAYSDKFLPADFEKLIISRKVVLVDFYAPWCLPCRQMEPVLDSLSQEFKEDLLISRVNIDEAKDLSRQLSIHEIPVVNGYKNGKLFSSAIGFQSEAELRTIIKKLLQ